MRKNHKEKGLTIKAQVTVLYISGTGHLPLAHFSLQTTPSAKVGQMSRSPERWAISTESKYS